MSQELLYTSAPRGLKPGSRGFSTVLSTQGMAAPLATALEGLSGYRPIYPAGDDHANRNPVVYSHLKLQAAGRISNVLSRIADFGLDYSQRANKLAHHVVLDKTELLPGGPASLLSMRDFMREEWAGEPKVVALKPVKREGRLASGPCRAWEELTGDAGWAGVLAESFLRDPERLVLLLFAPGQDILPLFVEALALLPAERRWDVTFSTYFTGLAPGTTCVWRALVHDSKEAHESLRFVNALRLDLTSGSLGRATGDALVEAARTGVRPHDAKPRTAPPIGPVEEEFVELEAAQVEFASDEQQAADIRFAGIPQRPPQLAPGRNSLPTTAASQPRSGRRLADVIEAESRRPRSRRWLWLTLSAVVLLIATSFGVGIATGRIDLAKLLPKPTLPPKALADRSDPNPADDTTKQTKSPSPDGSEESKTKAPSVVEIASPVFKSIAAVSVPENTLSVITVMAVGAEKLTYKIIGGVDAGKFEMTAGGVLTFKTAPDFEGPLDEGADNTYNLTVEADDGNGGTTKQSMVVTVLPVNDADPVFTSSSEAKVAEGQLAVMTIKAMDADRPVQKLMYKISGGSDGAQFAITADGVLTFVIAPNFGVPTDDGKNNVYNLQVTADDGDDRSAIQDIAVTVTQVKPIPSPPLPTDIDTAITLIPPAGFAMEPPMLLVPEWLKSAIYTTKKNSPPISLEIKNKGNTVADVVSATITVTSNPNEQHPPTTVKLRVKDLELTKQLGWCAVAINSKQPGVAKTHVIFGQFPINIPAKQRVLKHDAPTDWPLPLSVHSEYSHRPKLLVDSLEIEIGEKSYVFQRIGNEPTQKTELACQELLSDVTRLTLGKMEPLTASVEVGLFNNIPSIQVSLDKTKKAALLTKVREKLGDQLVNLRQNYKESLPSLVSGFEALSVSDTATASPKQFEDVAMRIKTDIEAAEKITGEASKANVKNLKNAQAEFVLLHEAVKWHRAWVGYLDKSKIVAARISFEVKSLQGDDRLTVYIVDFDDPKKGKAKTEGAMP